MCFVEHVSYYTRIKYQMAMNSTETVKAKPTFEMEAKIQGVEIKGYHTDNVIFNYA